MKSATTIKCLSLAILSYPVIICDEITLHVDIEEKSLQISLITPSCVVHVMKIWVVGHFSPFHVYFLLILR